MSNIFDLLNINTETFRDFSVQANLVVDYQLEKIINSNTKRLKQIEIEMLSDKQFSTSKESLKEVIRKVKKAASTNDVEFKWTMHELRIISYNIAELQENNEAFTYALLILDKNWRNLFLNGLVFYMLNFWNNKPQNYRENVCVLIQKQLTKYQGNNNKYTTLKNHANFFEEGGPVRLAVLLKHKNLNVLAAPTIIGYKTSTISLPYYSDVILQYYNKGSFELSAIEEVLSIHTLDRTKKLLFANLITIADRRGDLLKQTQISKFASRILGDISLSSTWAPFNGATLEDKEKLTKARSLVNKWYTRKIIEVFFDVCVPDESRKRYWLKFINHIEAFKISGSMAVKLSLNADERIGGMFQNQFIETNSQKTKTSALILSIKDKVFVEFSDIGSLYIYNKNNYAVKNIFNRKYIDSINDLKDTSLSKAIESDYGYNYYNHEGSMRHAGYWQNRLDNWFLNVLNINV